MALVKILWALDSGQKEVVEGEATQEGLPFEPPGVPTSASAESNPLVATLRELGPSTECWLWVADVRKAPVPLEAELPTL